MKTNHELNQLINYTCTKTLMAWPRIWPKSLYSWKPLGARAVGRPKTRWEDDVKADITKVKVPDWKITVQDKTKWKNVAEKTKILRKL
jgi:hypothetical protein